MKTFEEIDPHLQIIRDIDQRKDSGVLDRRRAISGLVYRLADELLAGHPAPRFDDPSYFTRIDGLVPALATELVRQHDTAIAHRTHLAERLEAGGGESGAKAAQILRAMNKQAEPTTGRPLEFCFGGLRATLRPTSEVNIISDMKGTATYTMVGDVDESGRIEWRGGVDVQGQAVAVAAATGIEAKASEFAGMQRAAYQAAREAGHDLARSVGAYIAAEAEAPTKVPMDEAHRVKVQFTVCGTPFTAFADDVQIDDANWAAIKRARKWQKEIRVLLGQEG